MRTKTTNDNETEWRRDVESLRGDVEAAAQALRHAADNGEANDPARAAAAAELFDRIAAELKTCVDGQTSPSLDSALRSLHTILPPASGRA